MSMPRKILAISASAALFLFVTALFAVAVLVGMTRGSAYAGANFASTRDAQSYQPPGAYDDPLGGRLVAMQDGRQVSFPTLKTDYDVEVRGDLVAVTLTQRFDNPGKVPLDATYQFPLHEDAAVHAMTMRVGDEVVRAEIREREAARQEFEAAKAEGRAAALTEQVRPNLFTQSIGNLMPGVPVEVELRYVHAVERRDGAYHLTLPMVVGPRFTPGDAAETGLESVPAHPPVAEIEAPATIDPDRVSVVVRIDAGMPLAAIDSKSHPIDVQRLGRGDASVRLAEGRVLDNAHFELRYAMAGDEPQAGLLADWDPRTERGYFSLLIEPPRAVAEDDVTAREMVFVLDCSGSMAGQPMETSKAFMRRALRDLRPTDYFRIIRFSDGATEYSREPIAATDRNVEDAIEYVDDLDGEGGTHMRSGVEQALRAPLAPNTVRLVTFMTDGFIGNETEIAALLEAEIGEARLFSVGVGHGVNRFLIEEMARTGRGFARYVDLTEDPAIVAGEIAERLQTPVLTDIRLEGTDAGFGQLAPRRIPDLFDGSSVRVVGTYDVPGPQRILVHGKIAGRDVQFPVEVDLPAERSDGAAVRLMWARAKIADFMHVHGSAVDQRERREAQRAVTSLGLQHSLITQWTSFVAVSEQVVNADPEANADADVPVSQARGVDQNAYAGGATFRGSATPEPTFIGGLLLALGAAGAARRRRQRS